MKAGRVGVSPTEVDSFGHIVGGGSSGGYTKEEADAKFATKTNTYTKSGADNKFEAKESIGGLQFRDNDGTAQYKLPDGDWTNFNSGSGTLGMNLTDPTTQNITYAGCEYVSGGYQIADGFAYIDLTVKATKALFNEVFVTLPIGVSSNPRLSCLTPANQSVAVSNYYGSGQVKIENVSIAENTNIQLVGIIKV